VNAVSPSAAAPAVGTHGKVLAVFVLGSKAYQFADHAFRTWDPQKVDFLLMVYDEWPDVYQLPVASRATIVFVKRQMKFWYFSRFLPEYLASMYDLVMIIDADCGLASLDLPKFTDTVLRSGVIIAQPAVMFQGRGTSDHPICRVHGGNHTGRWTNFIEGGPFFAVRGDRWDCFQHFLDVDMVSGWGVDFFWCPYVAGHCNPDPIAKPEEPLIESQPPGAPKAPTHRACAIIDVTPITHEDSREARNLRPDLRDKSGAEWHLLSQRYPAEAGRADSNSYRLFW